MSDNFLSTAPKDKTATAARRAAPLPDLTGLALGVAQQVKARQAVEETQTKVLMEGLTNFQARSAAALDVARNARDKISTALTLNPLTRAFSGLFNPENNIPTQQGRIANAAGEISAATAEMDLLRSIVGTKTALAGKRVQSAQDVLSLATGAQINERANRADIRQTGTAAIAEESAERARILFADQQLTLKLQNMPLDEINALALKGQAGEDIGDITAQQLLAEVQRRQGVENSLDAAALANEANNLKLETTQKALAMRDFSTPQLDTLIQQAQANPDKIATLLRNGRQLTFSLPNLLAQKSAIMQATIARVQSNETNLVNVAKANQLAAQASNSAVATARLSPTGIVSEDASLATGTAITLSKIAAQTGVPSAALMKDMEDAAEAAQKIVDDIIASVAPEQKAAALEFSRTGDVSPRNALDSASVSLQNPNIGGIGHPLNAVFTVASAKFDELAVANKELTLNKKDLRGTGEISFNIRENERRDLAAKTARDAGVQKVYTDTVEQLGVFAALQELSTTAQAIGTQALGGPIAVNLWASYLSPDGKNLSGAFSSDVIGADGKRSSVYTSGKLLQKMMEDTLAANDSGANINIPELFFNKVFDPDFRQRLNEKILSSTSHNFEQHSILRIIAGTSGTESDPLLRRVDVMRTQTLPSIIQRIQQNDQAGNVTFGPFGGTFQTEANVSPFSLGPGVDKSTAVVAPGTRVPPGQRLAEIFGGR